MDKMKFCTIILFVSFVIMIGGAFADSPSPTPISLSPGTVSEPGQVSSTLTPQLLSSAVSGVDYYALVPQESSIQYQMFRADPQHSGVYDDGGIRPNNLLNWSYTTGAIVPSSPVVDDGILYIGSEDHNVYAIDVLTGERVWSYPAGERIISSPAIGNGFVYFGCLDNKVYAIDATTGEKIWEYITGKVILSSPVVSDDTVFIGSHDGKVYALDAITGTKIWDFTTGELVESSPSVANGIVYVGSCDRNVYAIDAKTGSKVWNFTTDGYVYSSPAIIGDVVYVGSDDNKVYALNALSGNKIWDFTTGSRVYSSPAVVDGVVYVGSHDDKLYAIEASSGEKLWDFTTGDAIWSSPAVANGIVYIGSYDGNVYAINATTGEEIWAFPTRGSVYSSPAVVNGVVYLGSWDNNIYAIGNHNFQSPNPTIINFNPPSITTGSDTFTLEVTGTNFINGAKVLWDGNEQGTEFISDTKLNATILTEDVASEGTHMVKVVNPDGRESGEKEFKVISNHEAWSWILMTANADWSGRYYHSSVAMPDGSIVLMGGIDNNGITKNDVWRSSDDGATWTQLTSNAEWSPRSCHGSIVTPDGSIVLVGGVYGFTVKNDVWRSIDKGTTWTQMTANAEWKARECFSSVVMPDGSIVIMGGRYTDTNEYQNDVWQSNDNGTTWTQMTASADWSAREFHSTVIMADGSIFLMGGFSNLSNGEYLNDVWRSIDKGATWTQVTSNADWSARGSHTTVTMPDGSIVLMGGIDNNGVTSDVWRSIDKGATWTQVASNADWSARGSHTTVIMPDGSIVLMGGTGASGAKNDVWRLTSGTTLTITNLNPSTIAVGSDEFTLEVTGTNFIDGVKVLWEGSERPTVFVSETNLAATILKADVANAGTYKVKVVNPDEKESNEYSFNVKESIPLHADITASLTSGPAPLNVTFFDRSEGNPTSWFWDFGEGNTSTQKNPSNIFTSTGDYNITLTVANENQQDTYSADYYISVRDFDTGDHLKIEKAVEWALSMNGTSGDHAKAPFLFVRDAYNATSGYTLDIGFDSWDQAKNYFQNLDRNTTPPRGSYVWSIDNRSPFVVALSLGDGELIYSDGTTITTGKNNPSVEGYLGWDWPPMKAPIIISLTPGESDGSEINLTLKNSPWSNSDTISDYLIQVSPEENSPVLASMMAVDTEISSSNNIIPISITFKKGWETFYCVIKNLIEGQQWQICITPVDSDGKSVGGTSRLQYTSNPSYVEVNQDYGAFILKNTYQSKYREIPLDFSFSSKPEGDYYQNMQKVLNANPGTRVNHPYTYPGGFDKETHDIGKLTYDALEKFKDQKNIPDSQLNETLDEVLNLLEYQPVKHIPKGWVLQKIQDSPNNFIKVKDPTDNVEGWIDRYSVSSSQNINNINPDVADTKEERAALIKEEIYSHKTEFLPESFPNELILATAAVETGGDEFNNVVAGTSAGDWGRGIMQIDWDPWVGLGSQIAWFNENGMIDLGRNNNQVCLHYYTNTPEGIEANIKDGLFVLKDGYEHSIYSDSFCNYADALQEYNRDQENRLKKYSDKLKEMSEGEYFTLSEIEKQNSRDYSKKLLDIYNDRVTCTLKSPGYLQVIDSNNRTSGFEKNGSILYEIPFSFVDENNHTVTILNAIDQYEYIVTGTENGAYGLHCEFAEDDIVMEFNAIGIKIGNEDTHTYKVDWSSLNQGNQSVEIIILNGNTSLEEVVYSNNTWKPITSIFTAIPENSTYQGTAPLKINFVDQSSIDPETWNWSFGDGESSHEQNPSHIYNLPGIYDVSLTVTNRFGTDTLVKNGFINVSESLDQITLFGNATLYGNPALLGTEVTASAIGYNTTFTTRILGQYGESEIGKGLVLSGNIPTGTPITFTIGGLPANCGIVNEAGTAWFDSYPFFPNSAIHLDLDVPATIVADFSAIPTTGYAPLEVMFTDNSTGDPYGREWDFGDGSRSGSNLLAINHTFTTPGTYTVSLMTTRASSSSSETKNDYITVIERPLPPTADFTAIPRSGPVPLTVKFSDSSTGKPDVYLWNFGDDKTSSDENPVHTYSTKGVYSVTLTVENEGGTDSISKSGYITVEGQMKPLPGLKKLPQDLDGDGKCEDLNGDRKVNQQDLMLFIRYFPWIQRNEPASAFDFNHDGKFDFWDYFGLMQYVIKPRL